MKIVDEKFLATYRTPGPCWLCENHCPRRDAAHVWPRSRGRIDHARNIVSLGAFPFCLCHHLVHNGDHRNKDVPSESHLLRVLAVRIGMSEYDIVAWRSRILMEPRWSDREEALERIDVELFGRRRNP